MSSEEVIGCPSCPRNFATRREYSRHSKTHTKPYSCEKCSISFASSADVKRHQEAKHGITSAKYLCTWPSCTFAGASRRDNLLRHMRKSHGLQKRNAVGKRTASDENYQQALKKQLVSSQQMVLLRAAQSGNLKMLQHLLDLGAEIMIRNGKGKSALHIAAAEGHLEMVQYLLSRGADVHAKALDQGTPFHAAVSGGHFLIMTHLLENGADVQEKIFDGRTALHLAAEQGDEALVVHLLDRGLTVQEKAYDGRTPLELAMERTRCSTMKILVENGADVRTTRSDGKQALQIAAQEGEEDVVWSLLERGADIALTAWGNPLKKSLEELQEALVERGFGYDAEKTKGYIPIDLATIRGKVAVLDRLLQSGAKVGAFALQEAVRQRNHVSLKKLAASSDSYTIDARGCPHGPTALMLAVEQESPEAVQILVDNGADRNSEHPVSGITPLSRALELRFTGIFEQLVGNDPQLATSKTLLEFYVAKGIAPVVKSLLKHDRINPNTPSLMTIAVTGRFQLHWKTLATMKVLLDSDKVDSLIWYKWAQCALLRALEFDAHGIIELLLRREAINLREVFLDGKSLLHLAAQFGAKKSLALLLGHADADINITTCARETPLHIAARYGELETVKQLLAHPGINLSIRSEYGYTARDIARGYCHKDIENLINDVRLKIGR